MLLHPLKATRKFYFVRSVSILFLCPQNYSESCKPVLILSEKVVFNNLLDFGGIRIAEIRFVLD